MVPSAIVVLPKLPLNGSGKVDRMALPAPVFEPAAIHEAPQGDVESVLAGIWAEVLCVARVGRHDNFFDLGGNSLQIARVHRLLEDRLHTGLSMVDLFAHPTVGTLAKRIERSCDDLTPAAADQGEQEAAPRRRAALLQRKTQLERIV